MTNCWLDCSSHTSLHEHTRGVDRGYHPRTHHSRDRLLRQPCNLRWGSTLARWIGGAWSWSDGRGSWCIPHKHRRPSRAYRSNRGTTRRGTVQAARVAVSSNESCLSRIVRPPHLPVRVHCSCPMLTTWSCGRNVGDVNRMIVGQALGIRGQLGWRMSRTAVHCFNGGSMHARDSWPIRHGRSGRSLCDTAGPSCHSRNLRPWGKS